jgi:hypothetical protein
MNSKTAALLFAIFSLGGMLLPGLTLAPTAFAQSEEEILVQEEINRDVIVQDPEQEDANEEEVDEDGDELVGDIPEIPDIDVDQLIADILELLDIDVDEDGEEEQ